MKDPWLSKPQRLHGVDVAEPTFNDLKAEVKAKLAEISAPHQSSESAMPHTHRGSFRKISLFSTLTALVLCLAMQLMLWHGIRFTQTVPPDGIRGWHGHAFTCELAPVKDYLEILGDTKDNPRRSTGILRENGIALGPPHSSWDAIENKGGGLFSHWGKSLIFSSRDGSDPRQNGRTYSLEASYSLAEPYRIWASSALWTIISMFAVILVALMKTVISMFAVILVALMKKSLDKILRWIPITALIVGTGLLIFTAVNALSPPVDLWIMIDSPGFIHPAISALSGGPFTHVNARPFVYPLFIFLATFISGSLLGVVYGQILFYLVACAASSFAVYIATVASAREVYPPTKRAISSLLALCYVYIFISYTPMYLYSFTIMAETIYMALSITAVLCLFIAIMLPKSSIIHSLTIFTGIIVTWANVLVKPQWILAAIFLSALFLVHLLSIPKKRAALLIVTSLFAVVLGLLLPERYLAAKYDPNSKIFGPLCIFCAHSDLIAAAYTRAPSVFGDVHPDFAHHLVKELIIEASESDGDNGFSRCMWGKKVRELIDENVDIDAQRGFLLQSFFRAVLNDPVAYARKMLKQIQFALAHPFINADAVWTFDKPALGEALVLAGSKISVAAFIPPNARLTGSRGGVFVYPFPFNAIDENLNVALVIFGCATVVTLGLLGFAPWPASAPIALSVAALGSWFFHCLLIAATYTMEVGRYIHVAYPMALLGLFALLGLAIGTVAIMIQRAVRQHNQ